MISYKTYPQQVKWANTTLYIPEKRIGGYNNVRIIRKTTLNLKKKY